MARIAISTFANIVSGYSRNHALVPTGLCAILFDVKFDMCSDNFCRRLMRIQFLVPGYMYLCMYVSFHMQEFVVSPV